MKIREGAYYLARGGQVFGPMVPGGTPASDYVWCLDPLIQGYNWDSEGNWRKGWDGPLDLIAEVYISDTPPAAQETEADWRARLLAAGPGPLIEEHDRKTLRDEFAGYAIIGLLAAGDCHAFNRDEMAAEAYRQADAMMEARNK
jgi:hypothetical protein